MVPANLFSSSCISNEAELSGSDSGSTTGAGKTIGCGGSKTCWISLGEPGGGEAWGVVVGDLLRGGEEAGLALGVGSGVLTGPCLGWICKMVKRKRNLALATVLSFFLNMLIYISTCLFVCVEVLQPGLPNGAMLRAVSLPNHTFTGQA